MTVLAAATCLLMAAAAAPHACLKHCLSRWLLRLRSSSDSQCSATCTSTTTAQDSTTTQHSISIAQNDTRCVRGEHQQGIAGMRSDRSAHALLLFLGTGSGEHNQHKAVSAEGFRGWIGFERAAAYNVRKLRRLQTPAQREAAPTAAAAKPVLSHLQLSRHHPRRPQLSPSSHGWQGLTGGLEHRPTRHIPCSVKPQGQGTPRVQHQQRKQDATMRSSNASVRMIVLHQHAGAGR